MKKISLMVAVSLLTMLMSCSDTDNKTITATSTEFTSGELAKYVVIDDESAELFYAEQDGVIPSQYIRLKVTLKMIKDGYTNVDARDIDFTSLLAVAIINLVDENGTTIQDLSVKNEDLLKLKQLLTSAEGTTEEIVFEGEFHNSDDAPKWFRNAVKFTPYLTGDIYVNGASGNTSVTTTGGDTQVTGGLYIDDEEDEDADDDDDLFSFDLDD